MKNKVEKGLASALGGGIQGTLAAKVVVGAADKGAKDAHASATEAANDAAAKAKDAASSMSGMMGSLSGKK